MSLSQTLYEMCGEFRELIPEEFKKSRKAADKLTEFLSESMAGRKISDQDNVADYTEKYLDEICKLISEEDEEFDDEDYFDWYMSQELWDQADQIRAVIEESYSYENYRSGSWFEHDPEDDEAFYEYAERYG